MDEAWERYLDKINAIWSRYVGKLLTWGTGEATLRAETAECLDAGRQAGRWK